MITMKIDKKFIYGTQKAIKPQILEKLQEGGFDLQLYTVGVDNDQAQAIEVYQDPQWGEQCEDFQEEFHLFCKFLRYEQLYYLINGVIDKYVYLWKVRDVFDFTYDVTDVQIEEWLREGVISFCLHWGDIKLLK